MTRAEASLQALLVILGAKDAHWRREGMYYSFQRGRPRNDGAITGTVTRRVYRGVWRRCGNVRIEADGTVTRFATATKAEREQAAQREECES